MCTLRKPLLIHEFGKSKRDSGFTSTQFGMVYAKIYQSTRTGGLAVGGALLAAHGQRHGILRERLRVIFAEVLPSTTVIITSQSWKLKLLGKALAQVASINGGN
ncbi:hypothetical protein QYE76_048049 [Lolium multiflorum]|uniref:Uncharacterized protein n=1 Tax=Lolium multiflorum TaxID=4521 RepID=A0AAD8TRG3_LOLMU|nr:hypothetical protein QYE76_048049 [Lolium multiflorum]